MSKRATLATHYTMPSKKPSTSNEGEPEPLPATLPKTAVPPADFLKLAEQHPNIPLRTLLESFLDYETVLRAYFAQSPDHDFVKDNHVNLVSLFEDGNESRLKIRARDIPLEPEDEVDRYIMPLDEKARKPTGSPALVSSFKQFKDQFNIFTEGSLNNLDWSNVIVAGSAVLTPLLEVPGGYGESKKALREYYHKIFAPASDIDLFLYGIDDPEEAIKKMEQIENTIKDNLLWEVTTIRTRNTVTIVSQYPNRHVQIVLRLYKSVSQILTGFDVNCSAFAFNGTQVFSNPRALAACMTQCNDIDLTRRSPSYENRLAKYASRGFEVYCPFLDRSKINPTIFERSFTRTVGLARLLILEKLPKPEDRENYQDQRRREMGRPPSNRLQFHKTTNDLKQGVTNEVAEWDFEDVSGYQKFSIPYGEGYHARKLEKLFFKKDLLLNAEWNPTNRPPNRSVNLHRHPVFFGDVRNVVEDCCGFCPKPESEEEFEVAEEEDAIYVSGKLTFLKDDPGRQEIGSFYPLGPEDYTDMAYVQSSALLCEAIVNNDVDYVKRWCEYESTDVNVRDFCGRTPLHLAVLSTSTEVEIVQLLIDNGARLVARLQDGRTALHLAAARGRADMVAALLKKSAQNEQERDEREDRKKAQKKLAGKPTNEDTEMKNMGSSPKVEVADEEQDDDSTTELDSNESQESYVMSADDDASTKAPTTTTGGFVKVKGKDKEATIFEEEEEEDDIYDINIVDWDYSLNSLHHAVVSGHDKLIETLVSDFGADVLMPVKIYETDWRGHRSPKNAILNLVLSLRLPDEMPAVMTTALLKAGSSSAQANSFYRTTALHYMVMKNRKDVLEKMFELDGPNALSVLNKGARLNRYRPEMITPLQTAITISKNLTNYLLDRGARGSFTFDDYARALLPNERRKDTAESQKKNWQKSCRQPIEVAIAWDRPSTIVQRLITAGADPSTITKETYYRQDYQGKLPLQGETVLEILQNRIKSCRKALELRDHDDNWGYVAPKPKAEFDPVVLLEFPKDSYQRFVAEKYLASENASRKKYNKSITEEPQTIGEYLGSGRQRVSSLVSSFHAYGKKNPPTAAFEQAKIMLAERIEKKLEQLLETESVLLEAGAKTYHELYPEFLAEIRAQEAQLAKHSQNTHSTTTYQSDEKKLKDDIFTVPFQFNAPYLGEGGEKHKIEAGYIKLFNAIWRGRPEDLETVKELTSGPSGEGENRIPALQISVKGDYNSSALFIALYRCNYEMAELVFKIVEEQYEEPEKDTQKRYTIDSDESEPEEESIDVPINFTIENTEVHGGPVKCNVTTMDMLKTRMEVSDIISQEESKRAEIPKLAWDWSILSYAIYKNDIKMVDFILELASKAKENGAQELLGSTTDFSVSSWYRSHLQHARLALRLGRIEILEHLMKHLTFGIPYDWLAEEDEEVQKVKPQYYQGLSVRGEKRKDWADNSYPAFSGSSNNYQKPMQVAVYYANLDSIKWLQSDRPLACLNEFLVTYSDTTYANLLKNLGNKLEKQFRKWLGIETNLLPLLAVKGAGGRPEEMEVLRYLLAQPGAVMVRNDLGLTPLSYAVWRNNLDVVKELLKPEYKADLSVRDTSGRNLFHLWFYSLRSSERLEEFLGLIPEDVQREFFTQRMLKTGQTPLAHWLQTQHWQQSSINLTILKILLKYSGGSELLIPNSEGNCLIHTVFQRSQLEAARILLEMKPELIHRENANGRTPLEIVTSQWLIKVVNNAPRGPNDLENREKEAQIKSGIPKSLGKKEKEEVKMEEKGDEEGSGGDILGTYELGKEAAEKNPGKRQLVSLAEANGLAERIRKGEHVQSEQSGFEGGDILSLW